MSHSDLSLQEAFQIFKKKRKANLNQVKQTFSRRSPDEISILRQLFLDIAKGYLGVPYSQRHLTPEDENYAELFLDCCGLIRRVLRDMKDKLGFEVGAWNQAYQYDTLPDTITKDQMQPGDLVFISAKYFNEKGLLKVTLLVDNFMETKSGLIDVQLPEFSKPPYHNMVHVEIWLGEGEKTIGARWKKGVVEVHDSYEFISKNYHSMEYHFKSINEWLHGNCRSHCAEHPWQPLSKHIDHNKWSIFAASSSQSEGEEIFDKDMDEKTVNISQAEVSMENLKVSCSLWKQALKNKKFCIGGKNGVALVKTPLLELEMQETELNDDDYFFKWVECKNTINYAKFKPGRQIVNHIENVNCLTTKAGLLKTLREYERLMAKVRGSRRGQFKLTDFFMETYLLSNSQEKQKFLSNYKKGEIWICKPSGRNQGKGIFLLTDINQLDDSKQKSSSGKRSTEYIIQRYIMNPLLIDKRKFDIRAYMLIASMNPQIVLYHPGYIRLACVPYTTDDLDLHVHLTNQYVQKKHPLYSSKKDDTIMSFDEFNDYVNKFILTSSPMKLETNWVYHSLTKRMKQIMVTCFEACKYKLDRSEGMFDLLGFDFMIDENMKVWLIEININPALHTNCTVLKEKLPPVVKETIEIVLEINVKRKRRESITDLESIKSFELLYHSQTRSNNSLRF